MTATRPDITTGTNVRGAIRFWGLTPLHGYTETRACICDSSLSKQRQAFQGTDFNASKSIANLSPPVGVSAEADAAWRGWLRRLNERQLAQLPANAELAARISSYDLAARMQLSIPSVTNISDEPKHILKLYGADDAENPLKAGFARNCILARRLVESGVRFVQLFNGSYHQGGEGVSNWDGHKHIKAQYDVHGPILDQPVAGLLRDLK